jgi:hypothetical protein
MAGKIYCDRCGKIMNTRWMVEGVPGFGGNCARCGDDLCAKCAVKWTDNACCEKCASKLIHRFTYRIDFEIVVDKKQIEYQDLIDAGNEHQIETCAYNEAMHRLRERLKLGNDPLDIFLVKEKEVIE